MDWATRHSVLARRHAVAMLALVCAMALTLPRIATACASCGCTLSADAAMGYSATAGWDLSVEYDYLHQNQLRSGTHAASVVPDGEELERETLNRYLTTGLSYSPDAQWNFKLLVPYVERTHSTFGDYESSEPLGDLSSSRSSSLGDIRLISSFQGFLPTRNLGVQLGVKLPTGHYGTAVDFYAGPAAGTPLDASLQPGTGSTDLIVGAYYYTPVSQDFDFFVNGQFQSAVTHRMDQPGDDYRPGNATNVSLGLRYEHDPAWVPQVQLNLLHKSRDQGALADIQNTAGSVAYLSPGLTGRLSDRLHLFGFVQVPLYSNLYGFQLFPRYTLSAGANYAF
jgi:hypothetical protein